MKNFPRLFVLCQELSKIQQQKKGVLKSDQETKQWLELDRLIALHSKPAIINDDWTIPVWNGVAVERGMDHSQLSL
ncbi:MAG: hypothetical protein HQL67_04165 [Magnetococcales bacterium]|nr:hypothetical protein [Magnetococcales bacterium]